MYVDALGTFKNISHQIKMILKIEREVFYLNNALKSLTEARASLKSEQLYVSYTLVERVVQMECDIFLVLKFENENLKEKLEHVVSLSNVVSSFSSDRGNILIKTHFAKKDRRNVSSKDICHYCGDKCDIRTLSY